MAWCPDINVPYVDYTENAADIPFAGHIGGR